MQIFEEMIRFLESRQENILTACGLTCLLFAIFILIMRFQSISMKRSLFFLELCVGILMIADAHCYVFQGQAGQLAHWMVRSSNFMVFFMTCLVLYFENYHVTTMFLETGCFDKLPKRLHLGFILSIVGMLMVVISHIFNLYYYFDENNCYHRGPLFPLGMALPFVVLWIQFSFEMQYSKLLRKRIRVSLLLFMILPTAAAIIQMMHYGIAFVNFSIWVSAVILLVSTLIEQNEMLSKAANNEMATGLPNTYGFLSEVDQVIHRQDITEYNGYYFDIVRMGMLNMKYGKIGGDEIIVEYAKAIRNALDEDEIIGRMGGDFFVALVKKENTDKFIKLMEDIPITLRVRGRKETVHVAAVFGGYVITKRNITSGQLLGNVTAAANYAKNVVHQPYVFMDEDLENEFNRVRSVEDNTRKAFKLEEFVPYYQPKVNIETNELIGAEALVRWNHDGQLIPPSQFVPIMESNGSICKLDFYMLEHVCMDLQHWLETGINPPRVSVNFSRKNLGNPNFVEDIYKVVKQYEIPLDLIQVEITETIDEYPMSYLKNVVEELRRYGLTSAIDDFGTGSSSVNLLKEVPFDVMKIDKAFVDYTDEKQKNLLASIIKMAKTIGIDVIAEGVENADQLDTLRQMGCNEVQGYVFDKPLIKSEFETRIKRKAYE